MFTSEIDKSRRKVLTTGVIDIIVALACWIFSAIYIACGHGKTSGAMVCLLLPCLLSGIGFLIFGFTGLYRAINRAVRCLWHFAMASFTVGMMLIGIFEIAGVTVSLFVFPIFAFGVLYLLASIGVFAFSLVYDVLRKAKK